MTTHLETDHPGSAAALHVTNLHKSYDRREVVCGIDFSVPRGTCFGLLGPNGAGKTTTLRCCLGLTAPDAGDIRLGGLPFPQTRRGARAGRRRAAVRQPRSGLHREREPDDLRRYFGLSSARPARAFPICSSSRGSRARRTRASRRCPAA
jgi:ABC-type multidrug transport system ATPase subunit